MHFDWDLLLLSPFFISNKLTRTTLRKEFKGEDLGILLDVGCGDKPHKRCLICQTYIGIETQKTDYVDVIYDGKIMPFSNGVFDTVLCTEVLEHVREPSRFLHEISRVLKKVDN